MAQAEQSSGQESGHRSPAPSSPQRAPNVELSGEMQEGGFEKRQWLVQRNGQFVQITELLYRVLEAIDGQRTVEDIAEAVSKAAGRTVSPGNVETLVADKLIPLGLVVGSDGKVATPPGSEEGASRSPLRIGMRTSVLSPALINPVTAVLMQLYRPPILFAVLAVTAVAQGWLYGIHGIGHGMHQALYQPGLLLVMLGFIIASAAFHEFGHASALRYGGGKVRGMGVGMYLVYPAFYTDVTDNYRLSRWNRIRTDLGGFYFNLIFALVTLGIYAITRWEFLLLVVLLVDLEIIHQTLPFVRLDGYWALADLTGLPDFFSQIGPFLRTYLHLPFWKGRELPPLKGWVKAVFAVYIIVTIPLLLFLFLLMVLNVPRMLATSWDSLGKQLHSFTHAQSGGDILGMIFAVVQVLLLALPTVGMIYILVNVARRLAVALWRWSTPTPARRITGALGSLAMVALIAFLWAPRLPASTHRSGPLYAAASFRPIGPSERGTIADAVRSDAHVVSVVVSTRWSPPPNEPVLGSRPPSGSDTPPSGRGGKGSHGAGSVVKHGSPTPTPKPTGTVVITPAGTPSAPTAVPPAPTLAGTPPPPPPITPSPVVSTPVPASTPVPISTPVPVVTPGSGGGGG